MKRFMFRWAAVLLLLAVSTVAWGYCARMRIMAYQQTAFGPTSQPQTRPPQPYPYNHGQAKTAMMMAKQREARRNRYAATVERSQANDAARDALRIGNLARSLERFQGFSQERRDEKAGEWLKAGQKSERRNPQMALDYYAFAFELSPRSENGVQAHARLERLSLGSHGSSPVPHSERSADQPEVRTFDPLQSR